MDKPRGVWLLSAIALAVAATLGALVFISPAGARSERVVTAATGGVNVNRFYYHDGPDPLDDAGANIAVLTLPKGKWTVIVKLWVDKAVAGGDLVAQCFMRLVSGPTADGDVAHVFIPTGSGGAGASPIVMSASHNYTTAGTLTVNCGDAGNDVQYHDLRVQAIRVDKIISTGI